MSVHNLHFAEINILQKDIGEIIVNEGAVLDKSMVRHLYSFLTSHLQTPFSLLINKQHSYTYDFDAQLALGAWDELNAIGVVAYNSVSKRSTESLALIPRESQWNMQIFPDRESALNWLQQQQSN